MKQKLHLTAVLVVAALAPLLGGCGQPAASPTATPPAASAEPTATPTLVPTPQEHVASEAAEFTYASPESQEISPEALQALVEIVSGHVQDDKVVGSELMVLKNRQVVLHEAFGWRDRDDEIPMERDTLFNIRSMAKPVVGTAIQMLIDEGKLALDDTVAISFQEDEDGNVVSFTAHSPEGDFVRPRVE